MAGHLLKAGYDLRLFTRTRGKAEKLLKMGAHWADSPGEAAKVSDVVFSMLGYPEEVEEVMLGEKGVIFMGSYYRLQPDLCLGLCRIFAWIYDSYST